MTTTLSRLAALLFLFAVPLLLAQAQQDPKSKKKPDEPEGLKALKHPDASVRYRAAHTLGELGPLAKFAVPELREALKDKNGLVRIKAAEALWRIDKTPGAVLMPVLLDGLKDADPGIRAAAPAVIVLLGTKGKSAIPVLISLLKDKEYTVKASAVTALGDLGPLAVDAAEPLLDLTRDKDFVLLEPFVGASLASLGEGALPTLTQAVSDRSAERRHVAASALANMGPGASPAAAALAGALKADDPQTRRLAAHALGKIGKAAKMTLPSFDATLSDPNPWVRLESALATWLISGDAKHAKLIIRALGDDSPQVREFACTCLVTMRAAGKDAVGPLMKLLEDKDVQPHAVRALGEIGPAAEKALPSVRPLLKEKDDETRLLAAFAVWQISGEAKESLPILEKGLASPTHDHLAARLLGEMGEAGRDSLGVLVEIYREETDSQMRQLLATAIKKIDPKVAVKLGIR
jgi:HEAT repeat protein